MPAGPICNGAAPVRSRRVILGTLVWLLAAAYLVPMVVVLLNSLRTAQEIAQGLAQLRLGAAQGHAGGQGVEAQQIAQHAPKTRIDQVGALGKNGAQTRAAPLQGAAIRVVAGLY